MDTSPSSTRLGTESSDFERLVKRALDYAQNEGLMESMCSEPGTEEESLHADLLSALSDLPDERAGNLSAGERIAAEARLESTVDRVQKLEEQVRRKATVIAGTSSERSWGTSPPSAWPEEEPVPTDKGADRRLVMSGALRDGDPVQEGSNANSPVTQVPPEELPAREKRASARRAQIEADRRSRVQVEADVARTTAMWKDEEEAIKSFEERRGFLFYPRDLALGAQELFRD